MSADLLPAPPISFATSAPKAVDLDLDRETADCPPERIVRQAAARLESSPTFRGRSQWVQFSCQGDCLLLDGCLPSYYLKQLAQEAIREVPGVTRIVNRIVVSNPFSLNPSITRSCEHE